jgi:hypothetical protein
LPRIITDVRVAGRMVFVTSSGSVDNGVQPSIHVFALGRRPSSALTPLGVLTFNFPAGWEHVTYALETRPSPGHGGSYDVFFNVGSLGDQTTTPSTTLIGLTSNDGTFTGEMHPDSIYVITATPRKGGVTFSDLRQVAFGLRNAAGIAIQPGTGDLYFEDNGINGGAAGNDNPQLSADELNVIPRAQIADGNPQDFGFAHDYIVQATGQRVGTGGVQPLYAYVPVNGSIAEGAQEIAHAPAAFPAPLNHGVFAGFYGLGNYAGNGLVNTQNPVRYYDANTGQAFDFISNNEAAIGHPVGWLSTSDSLFFADLSPDNTFTTAGGGVIYQIQAKARKNTIKGTVFTDSNGDGVRSRKEAGLAGQTVFVDTNGDGVRSRKEAGLAGQTVFIDYNLNGALDDNDVSTVTDSRGNYRFTGVAADNYQVRVVTPAGYTGTGAGFQNTVFKGKTAAGVNFGLMPIVPAA